MGQSLFGANGSTFTEQEIKSILSLLGINQVNSDAYSTIVTSIKEWKNQASQVPQLQEKVLFLNKKVQSFESKVKQLENEATEMRIKMESLQRVEKSRSQGKIIDSTTSITLKSLKEKIVKIRDCCFDFFENITLEKNDEELATCLLERNVFENGSNSVGAKQCFQKYLNCLSQYEIVVNSDVGEEFKTYETILKECRQLNQAVREMESPSCELEWYDQYDKVHELYSIKRKASDFNARGVRFIQLSPALAFGSENNIEEKANFLELTFQ